MALAAGERLGHFEILAPLGAGGMGVVYRARDTRLGRDVALKVLPEDFARDSGRLSRFEREARVLATLSHPGIAAIHGLEPGDDGPVLVMELVEGEGLDRRLARGRIPVRQVLELARQMAAALESAHAKGIIHRDLKPSNIKLTPGGQVKLLDFGLAKALAPLDEETNETQSTDGATSTGVVVGTAPYMSPEQARGEALDRRTDVWSFGCVLYEMLAGGRAFPGHTAEAVAGVLEREPVWQALPGETPAKVLDLLHRCLQKDRNHRLHDIADARIELEEALAEPVPATSPAAPAVGRPSRTRRWALVATGLLLVAAIGALCFYWGRRTATPPQLQITRLTFRPGGVWLARFTPDAQTVVYTAAWGADEPEVFAQRLGSPEARALAMKGGLVLATTAGEVLVGNLDGKLVRAPLEGGTPREIADHIHLGDWTRDGSRIAVVRGKDGATQLEFPVGRVLFRSTGFGWITDPKLSPSGDRLAFVYFVKAGFDWSGDLMLAETSGRVRVLSTGWTRMAGLSWSPDGREVWFTASREGQLGPQAMYAVSLAGKERMLARLAHSLVLLDVSPAGQALVGYEDRRVVTRGRLAGDEQERDLSWHDFASAPLLSADGRSLVFGERGEAGGLEGVAYIWHAGSRAPVRLGAGIPTGVSPDGKWVACLVRNPGRKFEVRIVPTGPGESMTLPRGGIEPFLAAFFPDGQRLIVTGTEPGGPRRLYVQDLPSGLPRPLLPEGWWWGVSTPDGRSIAALPPGGDRLQLFPLEGGGEPRPIPGLGHSEDVLSFTTDGRSAFVTEGCFLRPACRIVRLDLQTGRRTPWLKLEPPDLTGFAGFLAPIAVHPSGQFYAYSYERMLSSLYMIEGLK